MGSTAKERKVAFEGFTADEILALPPVQIEGLILTGQPIVFRAGSSTVLGEFKREEDRLRVELAQIDGGGEGVLTSLGSLVSRFSHSNGIRSVEWIVHAVNCAKPNFKLRRVLERRGFEVREIAGKGQAYYRLDLMKTNRREGWAEASRRLAKGGDDTLAWPEFANQNDAKLKW